MCNMKNVFAAMLFLTPIILLGQDLNCCKTKKEVENNISGYWKIKDSISKIRYNFWFEKGQGNLRILELINNDYEYLVLDDHPFVDIIKKDVGFDLKFTDLYENRLANVKYLDSVKMVLKMDGKNIEYRKTKN